MEFSKEFIEENKLEEAQVTAVSSHVANAIADLKGEWDGKANKDAEGILTGASKRITELTGVERDQGEKVGDFINRSWDSFSTSKSTELQTKIDEYDEKIKSVKGSEALVKEFEANKKTLEEFQKKAAQVDDLMPYKEKYETLFEQHSGLKLETAFNSVKPSFSQDVNSYEAKAKWDEFVKKTLNEWTPEKVEGEWMAINKENPHKTIKLSELISKDAELTELAKGRQQKGPNAKPITLEKIEGVPFSVPDTAVNDSIERSKLIKDHLLSTHKGLSVLDQKYSKLFSEYNNKIRGNVAAA